MVDFLLSVEFNSMVSGTGYLDQFLSEEAAGSLVQESLNSLMLDGRKVLVLIPDGTRSMPMPMMFTLFEKYLAGKAAALDYLVALGTHQPMTDAQLSQLVGRKVTNATAGSSKIFNHLWNDPETFTQIGVIRSEDITRFSNGQLHGDVPVRLNKLIMDYDHLLICGPVFPHEV
jgi:nickel-dependent lactate racemase